LQNQSVVFGFWKRKLKPDGVVDEYKALLVVKGFRKREKYRPPRYSKGSPCIQKASRNYQFRNDLRRRHIK